MKKILIIPFMIVSFTTLFGQLVSNADKAYFAIEGNKLLDNTIAIDGSPYVFPFMVAQIKDVADLANLRYNGYNDELEYETPQGLMALLKQDKFGDVFFPGLNIHLSLEAYNYNNAKVTGYLYVLVDEPNLKIYKREHIQFNEARPARTSYDSGSTAHYSLEKPVYFIKKGDAEIVELPTNKRKLMDMYPDKKDAINIYFKGNKGDYSIKNDLDKLAEIL